MIKIYVLGPANYYSHSNGLYVQMAILKYGDFFGGKGLINREPFDRELRLIINQLRQAEHLYGLFKNQF